MQSLRQELQSFRNQDIPHFRAEASTFSVTVSQLASSISALAGSFDALKETVKLQRESVSIKVFTYFVILLIFGVGGVAAIQSYFGIGDNVRARRVPLEQSSYSERPTLLRL